MKIYLLTILGLFIICFSTDASQLFTMSQDEMKHKSNNSNSFIILKIPDYKHDVCTISLKINSYYYLGSPFLLTRIKPGTDINIPVPEGTNKLEYEIHMTGGNIKYTSEKDLEIYIKTKINHKIIMRFEKDGSIKKELSYCLLFPIVGLFEHQKIIMVPDNENRSELIK